MRTISLGYDGARGEASIPVPLPPPASPRSHVLCAKVLATKSSICSDLRFGFRTSKRQSPPIILRMAQFSPELWTPRIRYGSLNSSVSSGLRISDEMGSANPLGQARASAFEIAISRFDSCRPSQSFPHSARKRRENGAGIPAFAHSRASLNLRLVKFEGEIAESLRPRPRIFPFCEDYRRRLVRSRLPPRTAVKLALMRLRANTDSIWLPHYCRLLGGRGGSIGKEKETQTRPRSIGFGGP